MTYVSCYYHAFQGAQQVGNVSHVPEPTREYTYVPNYDVTKFFLVQSLLLKECLFCLPFFVIVSRAFTN